MRASRGITGLVLGAAVLVAAVSGDGAARAAPTEVEKFVPGSASASGSVALSRLFYGGLSLPVGIGVTSASYTNQQSRSLGAALDLGAYVSLVSDVPPELAPTVIDSNNGDLEVRDNLGAGEVAAQVDLRATQAPASSAEVRMVDVDLPALVRIEGAHATSSTKIHDDSERRASAVVEITRLSVGPDLLVLEDLRWEATQHTGLAPVAVATFTVGNVRLAGLPLLGVADDLAGSLDVLNAALELIGLRIDPPIATKSDEGAVTMGPLRILLADSVIGTQLLAPILASARPILAPVLEAVTDADSTLGLVSLVADLVLGVVDGSGGVEVSIGGARAVTDDKVFARPPPTIIAPTPTAPPETPGPAADTVPASAPVAVSPPTTEAGTSESIPDAAEFAAAGTPRCVLVAAPQRRGGCRASNALVAAAVSAIAVVGVATAELGARRRRDAIGASP